MIDWLKGLFRSQKVSEKERFDQLYKTLFVHGSMMYAGTLLQRAANMFPNITALICQDRSISYKELYEKSVILSTYLQMQGVKPEDRIIVLVENSIEFYIAYYGAWQVGAVVVPLNVFLHEKELLHIIHDSRPRCIILGDEFDKQLQAADSKGLPARITVTKLRTIIDAENSNGSFSVPKISAERMAVLLYTSGTTGAPKGVMLSSKNILTNLIQGICRADIKADDRVYAALPLFHSFAQFAFVWGNFFLGLTTIVVPRIERKLLLEGFSHKPTIIAGVPAMYGLFCLMRTLSFDNVRYLICGGDALPDKIRIGFELIYRRRLCNGYGLTETSPLIAVNLDDVLLSPNTVGDISIGIECSLRDEEGNEVQPGQKGVLWVKGDNIMLGYYNAPELNKKVFDQNGWLNTGDWTYFDKNKRLVIAGRHKDLIIHKGFNIYPQEIENILLSHPLVMQAAVVGKKDPDVGEIPVAFIVLREKKDTIAKDLRKLCTQHLAAYKMPKEFIVLDETELPLTSLRKIDKKALRKDFL